MSGCLTVRSINVQYVVIFQSHVVCLQEPVYIEQHGFNVTGLRYSSVTNVKQCPELKFVTSMVDHKNQLNVNITLEFILWRNNTLALFSYQIVKSFTQQYIKDLVAQQRLLKSDVKLQSIVFSLVNCINCLICSRVSVVNGSEGKIQLVSIYKNYLIILFQVCTFKQCHGLVSLKQVQFHNRLPHKRML